MKYDYRVIELHGTGPTSKFEDALQELGADGWRLVHAIPYSQNVPIALVFERPICTP